MLTRTMFWVFLEQGTILQISEEKKYIYCTIAGTIVSIATE